MRLISVEKIQRPTSSSGLNWPSALTAACLARSSLVGPPSPPAGSPIDPDTSITIITRAALRFWPHRSMRPTRTGGAGSSSRVWGWSGSTPYFASIGAPIATWGLPGRNPNRSTRFWFAGCWTYCSNFAAAFFSLALTHGASTVKKGLSEKSVPSFG